MPRPAERRPRLSAGETASPRGEAFFLMDLKHPQGCFRALPKPANAKITLTREKSEAIFASGVSRTCSLRSLTSK